MNEYRQARFALLSQHGKDEAIRPALARTFDATLEVVRGFDTDQLGTFTREVARAGTQLEAARAKARLAVSLSGASLGLGSEGAFDGGPLGLGSVNRELIVLRDERLGLEVVGRASAPGHHVHGVVSTWGELEERAQAARFPAHALTLRPEDEADLRVVKGLSTWEELRAAFDRVQALSRAGSVFFEAELRAHLNPTRMQTIAAAAEDLVRRLSSACPACGLPGFGRERAVAGLPCEDCGRPTNATAAWECACVRCDHRRLEPVAERTAAAQWCPACNP